MSVPDSKKNESAVLNVSFAQEILIPKTLLLFFFLESETTVGLVLHSISHSMFPILLDYLLFFCKFHTYSTNLHTQDHKSS